MRTVWLPTLLALLLAAGSAPASEPGHHGWPWGLGRPACPTCPDDYQPKCLPAGPRPVCGRGADDYCAKPLPCVRGVTCVGRDDYCRRPFPCLRLDCYPAWFTCGAPSGTAPR